MNSNTIVLEASSRLRQLSFRALANKLERDARSTIPEAAGVLREHYFYQLANRLMALATPVTVKEEASS